MTLRLIGSQVEEIEDKTDRAMRHLKFEIKDESGKMNCVAIMLFNWRKACKN